MIGSLLYRLKLAMEVLINGGIKERNNKQKKSYFKNDKFNSAELGFLNNINIEFIFAEFGEERVNAGGSSFVSNSRLDPTLSSLKKFFPNAKYTVYADFDLIIDGVNLIKVEIPVSDKSNPRTGHRSSVYYRMKGLLNSSADFKCAIDSDMEIVSSDIIRLIYLTQKFGFCVPYNDRQLLRQDVELSLDTRPILDESAGMGQSYNQTPMTLWKENDRGELYYSEACNEMLRNPARGSYIMWKAAWNTGVYPYVLPKQFCVCTGNEGIGDEVILHVGHPSIKTYYGK